MTGKLTLGPVFYNWPPEKLRDFYFKMADESPIDSVCIGEVVCSKRAPFFAPHLAKVMDRLRAAGKEVIRSTLALIMTGREMAMVQEIAARDDFLAEANDIAACALLRGRPHVIGPFVNVYNEGTLAYLAEGGAARFCLPPELPAKSMAELGKTSAAGLEAIVFGRLPLAISARCHHARANRLTKDNCQYVCSEDQDGLEVKTIDGNSFLAINGPQTLSHAYYNLAGELEALLAMGIKHFRLLPQHLDMAKAACIFRDALDGKQAPDETMARLSKLAKNAPFSNGYFHGREGKARLETSG